MAGTVVLTSGCRTKLPSSGKGAAESAKSEVAWRRVGAWTGNGREQTESFESNSGSFRVKWQTKNEAPAGAGRFQLTLNSSISGRPLQVVVDETGARQDVAYVQEDPRVFFAVVDSINIDWSFTIEEAVTR
jgi:outer membrane biogenesis lipoprotein LolB